MESVSYYRDDNLPFFEIKNCNDNRHPLKRHAHDEHSIALVEQGSSRLDYANETVEISEGQVILIEADIMHHCQPKDINNWSYRMLYIKREWFKELLTYGTIPYKLLVKSLDKEGITRMQGLFKKLESDISALEKEEILIEMLEYFFRAESYFIYDQENVSNNDMACEKIREYIKHNFLEKIYLEELAELCGLSRYYIVKIFKQKYNITPHAYQISCRMNHAKQEMTRGRDIVSIAHEIGFYDQSHFSKTFKSYFGLTPQEYLKYQVD